MNQKHKFKQTEIGNIPEDWDVKTFGDVCLVRRGASPRPIHDFISTSGIPWVKIADATAQKTRYIEWTNEFIKEEGRPNTAIVKPGDLIVSNSATPGIPKFMKIDAAIHDGWLLLEPSEKIDKSFLYYLFLNERSKLVGIADGTVFKNLKTDIVRNHKVSIPCLSEQHSIAKILSDLDSKIELNQQMNKTLEATGKALFKHWFVDFEFLNEKGKPYKSSGGKMVDSGLGEMTKGWTVGRLGDICDITMGQSPPGNTYNEKGDGLPFYQGTADFGFRFPSRRVFCTAPNRFAEEGDVLLSVRAPVGAFNVAEERCAIGRGLAALRLKEKHNGFLYYLLRTTRSEWEKFEAEGTVFGSVTKSDVHDFKVVIPPQPLLAKFASLIEGLERKININEKQSRALSAIRDSLLPRLMSGQIRVPAR